MNVYFSGIGGVGIGPLAEIARDAGHTIMGSDLSESLVTEELREQGVSLAIGQDGTFLKASHEATPLDWFVYTAALPEDHPELKLAKELGIRTGKRDEFLADFLEKHNSALTEASEVMASGNLYLPTDGIYPLGRFQQAFEHAQRGGKVLLDFSVKPTEGIL